MIGCSAYYYGGSTGSLSYSSELLRYEAVSAMLNLARACGSSKNEPCPSTASSVWGPLYAISKGNDGGHTGQTYWHGVHGETHTDAYWQVELATSSFVSYVRLYKRTHAAYEPWYDGTQIRVGGSSTAHSNTVCMTIGKWTPGAEFMDFTCNLEGKYVSVTWVGGQGAGADAGGADAEALSCGAEAAQGGSPILVDGSSHGGGSTTGVPAVACEL